MPKRHREARPQTIDDKRLSPLRMRERAIRLGIAAFVPMFAVAGALVSISPDGAHTPLRFTYACLVFATTVPVAVIIGRVRLGAIWWSERRRVRFVPVAFVLYADLGLASVLLVFVSPDAALYGAALFAIIGVYVAHFVTPCLLFAHVVFTSSVIVVLGVSSWLKDEHDTFGVLSRVLVTLLVVNGTVALQGIFATDIRGVVRSTLIDATHDPLTGVLNRRGFDQRIQRLMNRPTAEIALFLIDVDNFKQINDQGGHDAGDRILVGVADRLTRSLEPEPVVARFGGDEFAVAVQVTSQTLPQLAERVHATASGSGSVRVSVGVSLCRSISDLGSAAAVASALAAADDALYTAKRAGSNCYVIAAPTGH